MTGDAPQPGETPRDEGNPWAFAEPGGSWWHAEPHRPAGLDAGDDLDQGTRPRRGRRRPPQASAPAQTGTLLPPRTEEQTRAYEAAAQDVAAELDPPAALESNHDQLDDYRYDPLRTPEPAPEPDVMLLPEPPPPPPAPPAAKERTTVALPVQSPIDSVRIEKLENSPFWHYDQTAAPGPPEGSTHQATGPRRIPRHAIGHPALALLALLVLGLLATFFAWVSAEPFWLAVGHGRPGVATVTACTGQGVAQRCTGSFVSSGARVGVDRVRLLGVTGRQRAPGTRAAARMVSTDSRQAYLGATGTLLHLRWILGFALVLICGYAIAGLTGARRLHTPAARRGAVLVSIAGPLALLAGFLLATY